MVDGAKTSTDVSILNIPEGKRVSANHGICWEPVFGKTIKGACLVYWSYGTPVNIITPTK